MYIGVCKYNLYICIKALKHIVCILGDDIKAFPWSWKDDREGRMLTPPGVITECRDSSKSMVYLGVIKKRKNSNQTKIVNFF